MIDAAHRRARRTNRRHHHRGPARLAGALVALLAVAGLLSPSAVAAPADGVPVLHLDGRGHGHGVGLSQWGARSMAAAGADAAACV